MRWSDEAGTPGQLWKLPQSGDRTNGLIAYYLGKNDHQKRVTTENTEGHRNGNAFGSPFRVVRCFPWLTTFLRLGRAFLLTFKIFEPCADFLSLNGQGICEKRRKLGAHSLLFTSAVFPLRLGRAVCSVVKSAFVVRHTV